MHYSTSLSVTVDIMLEAFCERCSFHQYIHLKPNMYGIQIYGLCDAIMFYTSNFEVYLRTQPEGPFRRDNKRSFFQQLCAPIYGSGRNVIIDNWFTNIAGR